MKQLDGGAQKTAINRRREAEVPTELFDNQEVLLTYNDLARILQVSLRTVRSYVMQDRIPYRKIGHHVRFLRSEIATWLEKQRRGVVF